MINLIILGPPGSGKGSITEYLKKKFKYAHISSGDLLRKARNDSKFGKLIKQGQDSGGYVDDEITNQIVADHLKKNSFFLNGFILDGFPRRLSQVKFLDKFLKQNSKNIGLVLVVKVPEKQLKERLTQRRSCSKCGAIYNISTNPPKNKDKCDKCKSKLIMRDDDKPSAVSERIKIYNKETMPVIAHYRKQGIVKEIDNSGSLEEAYQQALELLQ